MELKKHYHEMHKGEMESCERCQEVIRFINEAVEVKVEAAVGHTTATKGEKKVFEFVLADGRSKRLHESWIKA